MILDGVLSIPNIGFDADDQVGIVFLPKAGVASSARVSNWEGSANPLITTLSSLYTCS